MAMTEATAITIVERTGLIETEHPIPFEAAFSVWLASLIDQLTYAWALTLP